MTDLGWLSVDRLGSDEMVRRWGDHFSHPPLVNDLGCFRVAPDPMGVRDFLFPPFSGRGEGTGMLYLDGKHPASEGVEIGYSWYPDRVRRRANFLGLDIETSTRAAKGIPAALVSTRLANPEPERRHFEVAVKVAGRLIHTIEGWASIGPAIEQGWGSIGSGGDEEHPESWVYDNDLGAMLFSSQPQAHSVHGTRPRPDRVEGKTLFFDISLDPGEAWTLEFVVSLGENEDEAADRFKNLIDRFGNACLEVEEDWTSKIRSAFTPENSVFSGSLPKLLTEEEDLARLYYMTTVGCLCCRRANPLSKYGVAYVTLTPNYWTTASFLWDMMIAGPFYALLDPGVLRTMIEVWLRVDLRNHLSTDYVTGEPLGYWYAVNNTAIVRLAHDYVRWTGDLRWLETEVDGKKILEHLERNALSWRELDKHGHGLADCGGVMNLLECVPSYIHEVAAFNAMWVAALRQVAGFRRARGESGRAKELEKEASGLLGKTLELYVEGKGYWRCRQPDGSYNEVRHIYDFIAVLESIAEDLPGKVRREMVDCFQREHQTACWMRALSAFDDDAHKSFRVDLQWTGAYCSLPAQVVNGLYKVGHGEEALQWLRKVSKVARQGPIGQAHWVENLMPPHEGGAWKCAPDPTHGADWVVSSNGAYPAMFIESLFGARATLTEGLQWRGEWHSMDPLARLENLQYQGQRYSVCNRGIQETV